MSYSVLLTIMKLLVTLSMLFCIWLGSSGQTTTSTQDKDRCSINVFDNCTDEFTSLVYNVTENEVNFDKDALLNFYCSSNITEIIQCLRDHLDPTCGPDTAAYTINRTLASIPPEFSYDKFCRNDSKKDFDELVTCQTLFPNVKGYADCITGVTLNKTLDPTDICNFLNSTLGCSYKYTKIMCPNSTNAFKEFTAINTVPCNLEFENSPEAMSCDDNMEKACSVAYKPPPFDSTTGEFIEFICSERSRELQQCLRKVFAMCKDKNGYNISSITSDIQLYETQTAMFCSNNKEQNALKKCQAMFPKVSAFQDCVTGKSLNKTIDPADLCNFLQNSVGCTYKYTNLMCPESLDAFNKSAAISSNCQLKIDKTEVVSTCDNNIDQACSVAFSPPVTNDPEVYVQFICSGRAEGYSACVQKVDRLCDSAINDVSAVLTYSQSSENQTERIICADKTSYKAFAKCLTRYSGSDEYIKCVSKEDSNDTCSIHTCSRNSIQKMCPLSAEFYNKLFYTALVECKIISATTTSGTVDIPTTVSSSSNLQLSFLALTFPVWCALVRVS
ncbi:uncharacterized protein LOC123552045 isoform X2 [Mercenaria mercenaria]|uniref:uncharacterized protein LOC123552045 isoform X2 n=2 Tax=Mercenaria mercenaria TaxID=6596 RepID=UPI00234EBDF6|nr:uncharacterized protein LOC123552045 isoform X2 [Mercenaria mercenaria]